MEKEGSGLLGNIKNGRLSGEDSDRCISYNQSVSPSRVNTSTPAMCLPQT